MIEDKCQWYENIRDSIRADLLREKEMNPKMVREEHVAIMKSIDADSIRTRIHECLFELADGGEYLDISRDKVESTILSIIDDLEIHESKIEQIRSIINSPYYIQEDVLKYKMICEIIGENK